MAARIIIKLIHEPFKALQNRTFAKLYLAQTTSQLGDALSWVGLALLSYEISPEHSAKILATALTLRVAAYILFSPYAGVMADRVDRKKVLYITHFIRMAIICCLPFINAEWQIYLLVFFLNVFNAFFTPTYRAVIPQIIGGKYYREAIGLSVATNQMLGMLGPAVAGMIAVWLGARQIFFLDGATFIIAAFLIISIPRQEIQKGVTIKSQKTADTWRNIIKGIRLLFGNKILRFALAFEFIASIAGGMVLVNTIGHIKNGLLLDDKYYGWVMTAFAIGAAVSAFLLGTLDKSKTRSFSLISGAFVLGLSTCFANYVPYGALMVLWVLAGMGQSLAVMPSETLIAENIAPENQGKVYGSHYSFSHLWWAIAYVVAGFLGTNFPQREFLYGGLITLVLAVMALFILKPKLKS